MKKMMMLMALLGIVMGMTACGDKCEDGSEPDACGNCPTGDDDAT
jgi:hypothetical protein